MSTQGKEINGFDGMEKKKKKGREERVNRWNKERENLKKKTKMSGPVRGER